MRRSILVILALAVATNVAAQSEQQGKEKKKKKEIVSQVDLVPHEAAPIYQAEAPIAFTFTANIDRLRHDKNQDAPWRWASITTTDSSGAKVEIPLKVKTRGIWRLKQCDFPPLRLDFVKGEVKHTLFAKVDKPKLVTHCRDSEEYEQYLLQELQLYRVYNLLTPYSHRVRLARVIYTDSASGKVVATRYGFLEEEPAELAHRAGGMLVQQKGGGPNDVEPKQAAIFALFQYMIGNTDWSIAGLHNVEMIDTQTGYVPIAYDFDFAGAVNTKYASVDPSLPIRRVRDRLYRGYCVPKDLYGPTFGLFNSVHDSIYALYRDPIGKLLKGDRVKETLEYFDEFYQTINDERAAKRQIIERCIGAS
jgi:hypothetical protein